jgi:hypothetical protein
MQAGDRVMVYDSPGFPVDHYLYATVLTPSEAGEADKKVLVGAVVYVDHPGNLSHAQQRFVPAKKIMTAADVNKKADELRAELSQQRDADKRKTLREHIKGFEFMATQLAE